MNRNYILYLSTLLLFCLSENLAAQKKLSLEQAIKIGLENNYQIKIAESNIDIAERDNNWKNTNRYPTIDFNASIRNSASQITPAVSFITESYSSQASTIAGSIDLNWILFDGKTAQINKARFEELERQGNDNLAIAVENTVKNIIVTYYNGLIAREQLEVLNEVLTLSRDRIEYQLTRQEFGQATTFDVLQARDAYLNDSTNYVSQRNAYDLAINNLMLAMSEDDFDKDYELTDQLSFRAESYNYVDLRRKMLSNNVQLRLLQTNRNLSRVEKELEETFRKPALTLNAGLGPTLDLQNSTAAIPGGMGATFGFQSGNNITAFANLTFNIPLYDAGTRKRNVENAKIREMIAEINIEDQQLALSAQLKNLLDTYETQRRLVKITETLIDNARLNLTIADEQFKAGQINSFDYRTIQVSFINASQQRLSAIFNLKITETDLVQLIGGLVRN